MNTEIFQTWYDDRHDYALQFTTSLIDLDLHLRLQVSEKARTSAYQSVGMWHKVAQTVAVVGFGKEITTKVSCKYVKCGLFKYKLFLFCLKEMAARLEDVFKSIELLKKKKKKRERVASKITPLCYTWILSK